MQAIITNNYCCEIIWVVKYNTCGEISLFIDFEIIIVVIITSLVLIASLPGCKVARAPCLHVPPMLQNLPVSHAASLTKYN